MSIHEPCPIGDMNRSVRVNTICSVLRSIYRQTDDEDIKVLARIAVTMAKKMDAKLTEYKRDWDKGFWDEN